MAKLTQSVQSNMMQIVQNATSIGVGALCDKLCDKYFDKQLIKVNKKNNQKAISKAKGGKVMVGGSEISSDQFLQTYGSAGGRMVLDSNGNLVLKYMPTFPEMVQASMKGDAQSSAINCQALADFSGEKVVIYEQHLSPDGQLQTKETVFLPKGKDGDHIPVNRIGLVENMDGSKHFVPIKDQGNGRGQMVRDFNMNSKGKQDCLYSAYLASKLDTDDPVQMQFLKQQIPDFKNNLESYMIHDPVLRQLYDEGFNHRFGDLYGGIQMKYGGKMIDVEPYIPYVNKRALNKDFDKIAEQYAIEYAKCYEAAVNIEDGKKLDKLPGCLCVGKYKGKYYTGVSGPWTLYKPTKPIQGGPEFFVHVESNPQIPQPLQSRYQDINLSKMPEWPINNCAEIKVLSKIYKDHKNPIPSKIILAPKNIASNPGTTKPACGWCQNLKGKGGVNFNMGGSKKRN